MSVISQEKKIWGQFPKCGTNEEETEDMEKKLKIWRMK